MGKEIMSAADLARKIEDLEEKLAGSKEETFRIDIDEAEHFAAKKILQELGHTGSDLPSMIHFQPFFPEHTTAWAVESLLFLGGIGRFSVTQYPNSRKRYFERDDARAAFIAHCKKLGAFGKSDNGMLRAAANIAFHDGCHSFFSFLDRRHDWVERILMNSSAPV